MRKQVTPTFNILLFLFLIYIAIQDAYYATSSGVELNKDATSFLYLYNSSLLKFTTVVSLWTIFVFIISPLYLRYFWNFFIHQKFGIAKVTFNEAVLLSIFIMFIKYYMA